MPGKICPMCKKATFYATPTGGKCTQCGAQMKVPPNEGKGGRGKKCLNCGKYTVFNGKCTSCQATYK